MSVSVDVAGGQGQAERLGAVARYTVEKLPGDVTVIHGAIPLTDMARMLKGVRNGLMSADLADRLDVNVVFGPTASIEALLANPPPARGRRLMMGIEAERRGISREACDWLVDGWHGESSRALFSVTTGMNVVKGGKGAEKAHPHDSDDFSRCCWLVRSVPEVRDHLGRASTLSREWAALVAAWPTVEQLIESRGAPADPERRKQCTALLRALYSEVGA